MTNREPLSVDEINGIRAELWEADFSDSNIANYWNVSRKTIYNIKNGKRHANVPLPTVKKYKNYTIYPSTLVSLKTNKKIKPINGKVRINNNKGDRVTVNFASIIAAALDQNVL